MEKEILRMQDVCVGEYEPYGLDEFHMFLRQGEMLNIIGLSGSGKTVLYEFFMGHASLRRGKVIYNGQKFRTGERFLGVADVTCIGQESTLIPGLSVAENIFIITGNRKVKGFVWMPHIYYRARILLGQFAPDITPDMKVWELTPVQRRIVELLRAIESEVKLVVIDDAFWGYGQSDILKLLDILKILKEKGIAVIYESHEMDFTSRIADRIMVLRKGKNIRTFYDSDFDEQFCKRLLVGNEELPVFERKNVSTDQVALEMRNLNGGNYIRNLNLQIRAGEIAGIYDLNNRRNMELLQLLVGELSATDGSIYLKGIRYEPRNLDYAIARNIGYFSGNVNEGGLVEYMDFMDNLYLPILKKTSRFKIFRDRSVARFLKREYMESLGVPKEEQNAKAGEFDTYIQKSILLKRWVLFKPAVMVCVEPFGGADMIMRDIMFKALSEMAQNHSAIMIASQNMNELKMICDTIYVLNSDSGELVQRYDIRE